MITCLKKLAFKKIRCLNSGNPVLSLSSKAWRAESDFTPSSLLTFSGWCYIVLSEAQRLLLSLQNFLQDQKVSYLLIKGVQLYREEWRSVNSVVISYCHLLWLLGKMYIYLNLTMILLGQLNLYIFRVPLHSLQQQQKVSKNRFYYMKCKGGPHQAHFFMLYKMHFINVSLQCNSLHLSTLILLKLPHLSRRSWSGYRGH